MKKISGKIDGSLVSKNRKQNIRLLGIKVASVTFTVSLTIRMMEYQDFRMET